MNKSKKVVSRLGILLILAFSLLSCSTNIPTHLTDRFPANTDDNCLEIVSNIINPAVTAKSENDLEWEKYYKLTASPEYQKAWKGMTSYYHADFKKFKKEGSKELKVLERLGFEVTDEELKVPDLETFINKYKSYLDSKNIPEAQRIMPALGFKQVDSKEVKLVVPLKDSWPEKDAGWEAALNIRLKGRDISENVAEGRFPVFSAGLHDVFHFVLFAMHPEYAQLLRDTSRELVKQKLNSAILNRFTYALEILSLADVKKLKEIKSHLTIKKPTNEMVFNDFLNSVNKLSKEELETQSSYWISNYKNLINRYASGITEPYESQNYEKRIREFNFNDFLGPFYGDAKYDTVYYRNKVGPPNMILETMSQMDIYLEVLLKVKNNKDNFAQLSTFYANRNMADVDIDAELDRLIRLQVARIEYALWKSATQITLKQWAEDTLKPTIDVSSPTMKFIKDCFGENSLAYVFFQNP